MLVLYICVFDILVGCLYRGIVCDAFQSLSTVHTFLYVLADGQPTLIGKLIDPRGASGFEAAPATLCSFIGKRNAAPSVRHQCERSDLPTGSEAP